MHLISPMCPCRFLRRATHPSKRKCTSPKWRLLGCFHYTGCYFRIGTVFPTCWILLDIAWYNFSGPINNPPAKVNERHMNRGCGKLLLAAAEEHSHRCLAAATRVVDLFATHMGTKTFKCWATATWNHMKSWCSCFFGSGPLHKRNTARCRDDHWNL